VGRAERKISKQREQGVIERWDGGKKNEKQNERKKIILDFCENIYFMLCFEVQNLTSASKNHTKTT
jgi:hypothetical protein